MKTAAFKFVAGPALASAQNADDQLVAYDYLREIARCMGLKRETRRLSRVLRALRTAEREQLKFAELLSPDDAPKWNRDGHGRHRDGHNGGKS